MAANYSTLEIERLDGLDENEEQIRTIRMDADYSTVETERLDENGKNDLNFFRLVLMPLLFD
jgi:predicted Ser/Thr protein kinase